MSNFTLIKVKQSLGYLHIIQFAHFFFGSWCSYLHLSCLSSLLWHCSGAHRPLVLQEVWISGESSSRGESRDHFSFTTSEKYLRLNRFAVQTDHRDKARAAACANLRRSCASCSNLSWSQMTWKTTELMQAERRFCWLARLLVFLRIWRVFLKISFCPLASARLPLLHLCIMQPPPSFPTKWI